MARSSLSLTLYTPRFQDSHGSCGTRLLLGGNVTQALTLNKQTMPSAARAYLAFSIENFSLMDQMDTRTIQGSAPATKREMCVSPERSLNVDRCRRCCRRRPCSCDPWALRRAPLRDAR